MTYHRVEFYKSKSKSKSQKWRWRFVFQNGKRREIIAESSEGYTRRIDCKKSWVACRKAKYKVFVDEHYESAFV